MQTRNDRAGKPDSQVGCDFVRPTPDDQRSSLNDGHFLAEDWTGNLKPVQEFAGKVLRKCNRTRF